MYEVLLGKEGFRKGMDLYFERHDGNAVTCDDFRAAPTSTLTLILIVNAIVTFTTACPL